MFRELLFSWLMNHRPESQISCVSLNTGLGSPLLLGGCSNGLFTLTGLRGGKGDRLFLWCTVVASQTSSQDVAADTFLWLCVQMRSINICEFTTNVSTSCLQMAYAWHFHLMVLSIPPLTVINPNFTSYPPPSPDVHSHTYTYTCTHTHPTHSSARQGNEGLCGCVGKTQTHARGERFPLVLWDTLHRANPRGLCQNASRLPSA